MKRNFLGWDAPALPEAVNRLVSHYSDSGVARMDGALVVVPGSRAGRRMKELLEETCRLSSIRLVPPRVVTVGMLPEQLFEADRPVASQSASRLAWIRALRQVTPGSLERVFARRPEEEALVEWASHAAELEHLHREVSSGGYRFADVARMFGGQAWTGWNDSARWNVLAQVQERYETCLAELGLSDRDANRIGALDRGSVSSDADIWLVGVAELPDVTRRLLEPVMERVHILVHAPEDRSAWFDAFGCVVPEAWERTNIPLREEQISLVDDPAGQAEEVARFLADIGDLRAPDEIVIGAASSEVIPWIEERLSASGVAVRNAAGMDPRRTGPFRLLAAVAETLADGRWESYAALARHPDVGDWLEDKDLDVDESLSCADRWYERHLPNRLPSGGKLPGSSTSDGAAASELVALLRDRLLDGVSQAEKAPLKEWADPLLALLADVYGVRSFRADSTSDRQVVEALERLGNAFGAWRTLPDSLDQTCSAATAIRTALDQAGVNPIPNPQVRSAVELLGWLELHLDDAPVAVITGVNEPGLPESVTSDEFLPNTLRSRLGLTDNLLRYARDAYRLTAIAHSRAHLLLVAGRRSANGDPLRPSRLLFSSEGETMATRIRRFYESEYWQDDPSCAERVPTSPQLLIRVADGGDVSRFVLPPEPEFSVTDAPRTIRATDFRALLQDPYGFALSRLRGCESIDDHARELDGARFGSLAHAVLERFGRDQGRVHVTDASAVAARLDELLDARVDELFGRGARYACVAVRIQVEQLRARLHRFAAWHVRWISDGWQVRGVEVSTPQDGIALEVDDQTVGITARIDRVDYHEERDEWALLDYKTADQATDPRKSHGPGESGWRDLQLPLYHWIFPQLYDASESPRLSVSQGSRVLLGYVTLSRDSDLVQEAMADWTNEELTDAVDAARDAIRRHTRQTIRFSEREVPRFADVRLRALLGLNQLGSRDEVDE